MNVRKYFLGAALSALLLLAAFPARAGIPVIDATSLVQQIQQVVAWGEQAQQMTDQYNKMQQQYQQMQTMTSKLDGGRSMGTFLNNESTIQSGLPTDIRNPAQLLLTPGAPATSTANMGQILTSFGVSTTASPTAGLSAADSLGRAQQVLATSQVRSGQLQQLATRVDSTADAKESLDMVSRNVLEAANINNQMIQAMASQEVARQAAELRRTAENQTYFSNLRTGAASAQKKYSY